MSVVDKHGVKIEPAGRTDFNPWPILFAWADSQPQVSADRWRQLVAMALETSGWTQAAIANALALETQGAVSKMLARAKTASRGVLSPAMKAAGVSQRA